MSLETGTTRNARDRYDRFTTRDVLRALIVGIALALACVFTAPSWVALDMRDTLVTSPIGLRDVHGREQDGERHFRRITGHTTLSWAGQPGVAPRAVVLDVAAAPGHDGEPIAVMVQGRETTVVVTSGGTSIRVPLPPATRLPLVVEVRSATTRPARDPRELGVRLYGLTIENGSVSERLRVLLQWRGLALVAFGALASLASVWALVPAARRWHAAIGAGVAAGAVLGVVRLVAGQATPGLTVAALTLALLTTSVIARERPWMRGAAIASGAMVGLGWLAMATWSVASFVDVPRWDIWEMAGLLEQIDSRGLAWADLWAPHNEHRPLVARAVILANIAWSRWNHWNELWAILAVLAAHALVLVVYVRRATTRPVPTLIAIAGVVAFGFTAVQWENLLQGWQITLLVGALCVTAGFVVIERARQTWLRLAGAALCLLAATASFGTALVAWPIAALPIVVRREAGWRWKLLAWSLVSAFAIAGYLRDLDPPDPLSVSRAFQSFAAVFDVWFGTLIAMGQPVWYRPLDAVDWTKPFTWVPAWFALLGLLGAAGLLARHARRDSHASGVWLLPAMLMAFSVGACVLMSLGRVPALSLVAMTASRYAALSAVFWIGLVLLCVVAPPGVSRRGRGVAMACAVVVCVLGVRAWSGAWPLFERHAVGGMEGRDALLREDWSATGALYPLAPKLDRFRQYLRTRGLSIYRPTGDDRDR